MPEATTALPRWRGILYTILAVTLLGAIIAPVTVYLFGVLLIAPYEGDGGLLGFLGSVYGDALAGRASAWGLLLSPAAFILTWWAVFRIRRLSRPTPPIGD